MVPPLPPPNPGRWVYRTAPSLNANSSWVDSMFTPHKNTAHNSPVFLEPEVSEVPVPQQVRILLRSLDGDFDRHLLLQKQINTLVFGRASSNLERGSRARLDNAFIDSPIVSRSHCEIYVDLSPDWAVYLKDCGSTHGTYLNNQKVSAGTASRVYTGDRLKFGIPVVNGPDTFHPKSFEVRLIWEDRPRLQSSIPTPEDSPKGNENVKTFSVPNDSDSEADSTRFFPGEKSKCQGPVSSEPASNGANAPAVVVNIDTGASVPAEAVPAPAKECQPKDVLDPVESDDSSSDNDAPESIPIHKSPVSQELGGDRPLAAERSEPEDRSTSNYGSFAGLKPANLKCSFDKDESIRGQSPDYSPAFENDASAPQDGQQRRRSLSLTEEVDLYGYDSDIPSEDELMPNHDEEFSRDSDPNRPYGDDVEEDEPQQFDYPSFQSRSESVSSVPSVAGSFPDGASKATQHNPDDKPMSISSAESSDDDLDEDAEPSVAHGPVNEDIGPSKTGPSRTHIDQGSREVAESANLSNGQNFEIQVPAVSSVYCSSMLGRSKTNSEKAASPPAEADADPKELNHISPSFAKAAENPTLEGFRGSSTHLEAAQPEVHHLRTPSPIAGPCGIYYQPTGSYRRPRPSFPSPYTDGPFAGPFSPLPAPTAHFINPTSNSVLDRQAREELAAIKTSSTIGWNPCAFSFGGRYSLPYGHIQTPPKRVSIQDLVNSSRAASKECDGVSIDTSKVVRECPPSSTAQQEYICSQHRATEPCSRCLEADSVVGSFPSAQPRSPMVVPETLVSVLSGLQGDENNMRMSFLTEELGRDEEHATATKGVEANIDDFENEIEEEDIEEGSEYTQEEEDDDNGSESSTSDRSMEWDDDADFDFDDADFETAWAVTEQDSFAQAPVDNGEDGEIPARKKRRLSPSGAALLQFHEFDSEGSDVTEDESDVLGDGLNDANASESGCELESDEEQHPKMNVLKAELPSGKLLKVHHMVAKEAAEVIDLTDISPTKAGESSKATQKKPLEVVDLTKTTPAEASGLASAAIASTESEAKMASEEKVNPTQAPASPNPTTAALVAAARRNNAAATRRRPAWRSFVTGALAGAATVLGAAAALLASVPEEVREEALREW